MTPRSAIGVGIFSSITAQPNTFMEIDSELLPMVTRFLQLIEERLLSVTSEIMCTILCMVNGLANL